MILSKGDRIHVEFDATVKDDGGVGEHLDRAFTHEVVDDQGVRHYIFGSKGVTLLPAPAPEPENWPPQVGDVWGIENDPTVQYHVIRGDDGKVRFIYPAGGYDYSIMKAGVPWVLRYRPERKVV